VAEVDEKVMDYVEKALGENPDKDLDELMEGAKKVSPSVGKLSRRQFNARYPLQVKRRKAQAEGTPRKKGKKATPSRPKKKTAEAALSAGQRDAVRDVFLDFATELSGAEERKDLVKVLANVDKYVEKAVKGMEKA
jgi:hypothetical protein